LGYEHRREARTRRTRHGIGWPALVLAYAWAFLTAATLLTGVICLIGAACYGIRSLWRAMTANFRSDASTL
jgi:hypothetical protein